MHLVIFISRYYIFKIDEEETTFRYTLCNLYQNLFLGFVEVINNFVRIENISKNV